MTAETHARSVLEAMAASARGARTKAARSLLEDLVGTYKLREHAIRAATVAGIQKGWFSRSRTGTLSLTGSGSMPTNGDMARAAHRPDGAKGRLDRRQGARSSATKATLKNPASCVACMMALICSYVTRVSARIMIRSSERPSIAC